MEGKLIEVKKIKERNIWFDNRLKELKLDSFIRISDCLDKVELYHSDCGHKFEDKPRNFFRKNNKCEVCYQKGKNEKFQIFLNDKFGNQFKLIGNYDSLKSKVQVEHLVCGRILNYNANYYIRKKEIDLICTCQKEKFEKELKESISQIEMNNKNFDKRLVKEKLINFKRIGDYIDKDTKLKIFHLDCQKEFEVEPKNFFRRKHKCDVCAKKYSRKQKRSIPKNKYYQNQLDELTNNEFKLLSDYYNLSSYVKLRHNVCGYEFEVRADNFNYNKEKCPKCAGREDKYNKTNNQRISELEKILNDEYKILTKFFTSKSTVELEHKKCGTKTSCSVSTIYNSKLGYSIKCEKCYLEERKEKFLDKLDRLRKGDYKLRGKYNGVNKLASFRHIKCGHIFKSTPYAMLRSINEPCPKCKEEERDKYFNKKINDFFKGEYKYIGFSNEDKKIILEHKLCSKKIKVFQSNVLKSKNPCKECRSKNDVENRKKYIEGRIKEKCNNKYKLIGEYVNAKTKVDFYCKECNSVFSEKPSNMLFRNKRCPHCKK